MDRMTLERAQTISTALYLRNIPLRLFVSNFGIILRTSEMGISFNYRNRVDGPLYSLTFHDNILNFNDFRLLKKELYKIIKR